MFKSILLVDDDKINNFVTEKLLKRTNLSKNIKSVTNGEEALTFLSEDKNECPELIFLDINMPEMDGLHFLKYFRTMVLDKKVKVVLLSGHISPKQRETLYGLGFPDVIEKPLTEEKLSNLFASNATSL